MSDITKDEALEELKSRKLGNGAPGSGGPSLVDRGLAFAIGAAESQNPLPLIRTADVAARAIKKFDPLVPMQPQPEELTPPSLRPMSFSEKIAEASGESKMPEMSIRQGLGLIPGVAGAIRNLPEDWEKAGMYAGTIASLLYGGYGAAKGTRIKRAATSRGAVERDIKFLTGEAEGPVLSSILDDPGGVLSLYRSGKMSANDLANGLRSTLEAKQKLLGETVGSFRDLALSDNAPSIRVGSDIQRLNRIEDSMKTSGGVSVLESSDIATLKELRDLMPSLTQKGGSVITPRDAVLISDKAWRLIERANAKPGYLSSQFVHELRAFRNSIKDAARNSTGIGAEWALADKAYEEFKDSAGKIMSTLESRGSASFVDNLLSKNKEPIRDDLRRALSIGELDPEAVTNKFFKDLASTKAAQGLKALDVTKADPIRDQVNRLFQKWMRRGELYGAAVGSGVGAKLFGTAGAVAGTPMGGFFGHVAMEPFARRFASPEYLLSRAMKSKALSAEAKQYAQDLNWLQKKLGVEAANIFWNATKSSVPFANSLARFYGVTGKSQENMPLSTQVQTK